MVRPFTAGRTVFYRYVGRADFACGCAAGLGLAGAASVWAWAAVAVRAMAKPQAAERKKESMCMKKMG
jgi:hypothetical protein